MCVGMFEHLFIYIYYNQLGKHFTGSLLSFTLPQPSPLKLTSSLPWQQGENSRERGRLSTSILFLHLCHEGWDGSGGDASGGFVSTQEPAALLLLLMSVLTSLAGTSALQERTAETSVSACWEQGRIVPSPVSAAGDK